jgi:hypothetical protein
MVNTALAELTKEATALPYEEQKKLLNALNVSVLRMERKKQERTHEENLALVKSFMGVSSCWKGENILEYQRKLRGEYHDYD